ncbi:MAG: DUF1343 domain-containing protein [Elusimicrobia bacterium]|nr:DUF1343 domain-containing protein [Elusimicrobiota bacterium]
MRRLALAAALALLGAHAGPAAAEKAAAPEPGTAQPRVGSPEVLAGIDVLEADEFRELSGKRIGLITNQTGKDRKGRLTARVLAESTTVQLKALFSPEHGFTGTSEADAVSSETYRTADGRNIPIYSLYGDTRAPTTEMMKGLDTLVFDIQDMGTRFYTYATTMGMAMEAAAAGNLDFVVLDRPDPISGEILEGPVLSTGIRHFTAFTAKVGARLEVVPLRGWARGAWYDQTGLPWTRPSPNLPDLEAATLYPGIGCFESTNLSVGRGTPAPFRWVGAPWLKAGKVVARLKKAGLAGVSFEAEDLTPTKSVYENKKCAGIRIRVTDRDKLRPLALFAHLLAAIRDLHPKQFEVRWDEERRMIGTDALKALYEKRAGPEAMIELFDAGPKEFDPIRHAFLLY